MNELIIKNPLTDQIRHAIFKTKDKLNIAVPFISSFAIALLNDKAICNIPDKRIVTRFDNSILASFDLPTLKKLIDLGFSIHYDNSIHLKLYIFDDVSYVSSSNLTMSGFESNVELTVKTDTGNSQRCVDIFEEIWANSSDNFITDELLTSSWSEYEVLRHRDKKSKKPIKKRKLDKKVDIQDIKERVFTQYYESREADNLVFEANKRREAFKHELLNGYNLIVFYAPKGHSRKKECITYDLAYGYERKLVDTGLRESQFRDAFEHRDFEKVAGFIYPDMLGMKPWNFYDMDELSRFCNGLFVFELPQYKETLPIRLASYFYPEIFIPIFKIKDLARISKTLGLQTDAKSEGDMLFEYNSFISDEMKALPVNNYVKSDVCYRILFTVELYNKLKAGYSYIEYYTSNKEKWKKAHIENGYQLLKDMDLIK